MAYSTADVHVELMEQGALWKFLHDLFRFPTVEQWEWVQSYPVREAAQRLLKTCPESSFQSFLLPESFDEYEEVFLYTFEVGLPHPPCPLLESHWNKRDPLPRILHENILFYKQFGLELKSISSETADHLRYQTEFIAYLYNCEASIRSQGDPHRHAEQLRQGRVDYIHRHWYSWVPAAVQTLQKLAPDSWPSCWMQLLLVSCAETGE